MDKAQYQSWEHIWSEKGESGRLGSWGKKLAKFGDLQRIIYDSLMKAGLPGRTQSVLEIGCGTAPVMEMISGCTENRFGTDISKSSAALAGKHCLCCVADGRELPFAESTFHLVFTTGVLDLYQDDQVKLFLQEISRVLHRGGRAVVTVAAEGCAVHCCVMRYLVKRGRWRYGSKRTFSTLAGLLPSDLSIVSENGRGALFQMRFISYLFEGSTFLRRIYHGIFLVISAAFRWLNRFPGALSVTIVEKN